MNPAALRHAIARLEEQYGPEVVQLATLVHTARHLYACAGATRGISTAGVLKALDACVESRMIDRDIYPPLLHAALQELDQELAGTPA